MIWRVGPAFTLAVASSVLAFQSIQDPQIVLPRSTVQSVKGESLSVPADSIATVLIFLEPDCPIGNRFVPEIARIQESYSKRGISFFLVYPAKQLSKQEILQHLNEYELKAKALSDPNQELVKGVKATVTPEAAVLDKEGKLLYRGRINDLYLDHSRSRVAPTRNDLRLALDEILAGKKVSVPLTTAVGCFIQ